MPMPVSVSREHVMGFILSRGYQPFTTVDIADALGCLEYAARAAVSWLKMAGFIEFLHWHDDRRHVKVYRWTGQACSIYTVRRNAADRAEQMAARQSEAMRPAADALGAAMGLARKEGFNSG